jgi:hypothetical protein
VPAIQGPVPRRKEPPPDPELAATTGQYGLSDIRGKEIKKHTGGDGSLVHDRPDSRKDFALSFVDGGGGGDDAAHSVSHCTLCPWVSDGAEGMMFSLTLAHRSARESGDMSNEGVDSSAERSKSCVN